MIKTITLYKSDNHKGCAAQFYKVVKQNNLDVKKITTNEVFRLCEYGIDYVEGNLEKVKKLDNIIDCSIKVLNRRCSIDKIQSLIYEYEKKYHPRATRYVNKTNIKEMS